VDSATLKSKVEAYIGEQIPDEMWPRAEEYARKKLDRINEMAGRQYGDDGYGDEYLVLLTADTVREMAFSEYTLIRSMEIMAARAAQERCVST